MGLAQRVKNARDSKGLKQDELARLCGIKQQYISAIERGRTKHSTFVSRIAKVLDVNVNWLLYGQESDVYRYGNLNVPKGYVPIVSLEMVCKLDNPEQVNFMENTEFHPLYNQGSLRSFAVRIADDSMVSNVPGKKSFLKNDVVIADPEKPIEIGKYVVAHQRGATVAIFRQYIMDGLDAYLLPLNSDYSKIKIDDTVKICGVGIGHTSSI